MVRTGSQKAELLSATNLDNTSHLKKEIKFMPVVTIKQATGRSKEQKALLVKKVTEAFVEAYGASAESVTVFLQEYDDSHWGIGGVLREDKSSAT